MFAVVDIETTGGNHTTGRITEVACYVFDGQKIVTDYETLVNPEIPVPPFIEQLTGITNKMVKDAPLFSEVARDIAEVTANKIFVAHNVNFDYNFLRMEFRKVNMDFKRKKMCTIQSARRVFPGLPSYSLGKLCRSLDIPLENRHRAAGDAHATTLLLQKMMVELEEKHGLFAGKVVDEYLT